MAAVVSYAREFHTVFAGRGVQMILCSYCVLNRWDHDDLTAPYWRWYWNDTPGATVTASGEAVGLGPDRVVLIPPGTAFATHTLRPVGHLHFHFVTGVRVTAAHRRPTVRVPGPDERRLIRRLVAQFRVPQRGGEGATDFLSHALAAAAMADVPADHWETIDTDADVARVLAVMHERPAAALDTRTLSDVAALAPNTLLRRFRRMTGTTPHRYLTRLRADNAAIQLRTTNDSIEAIARRCGFCDRFHLSKAFKQLLGSTPAAYRTGARAV